MAITRDGSRYPCAPHRDEDHDREAPSCAPDTRTQRCENQRSMEALPPPLISTTIAKPSASRWYSNPSPPWAPYQFPQRTSVRRLFDPEFEAPLWLLFPADLRRTARVRVVVEQLYDALVANRDLLEGQSPS